MKSLSILLLTLLASVSHALASGDTGVEELGLMTSLFIAFGILIVLYQFIPGLVLIGKLLKGLFSSIDEKAIDAISK